MGLTLVIFNSPNQLKFLDRSLTPFPQRESIRSSIAKGTAEVAVSTDEQCKNYSHDKMLHPFQAEYATGKLD